MEIDVEVAVEVEGLAWQRHFSFGSCDTVEEVLGKAVIPKEWGSNNYGTDDSNRSDYRPRRQTLAQKSGLSNRNYKGQCQTDHDYLKILKTLARKAGYPEIKTGDRNPAKST